MFKRGKIKHSAADQDRRVASLVNVIDQSAGIPAKLGG